MAQRKPKVEVFENMNGEFVASNGLTTVFGKTEKEARKNFKEATSRKA